MKTLFVASSGSTHGIIPDEVYCQGSKEDGYTYHRRVANVNWFIEEYEQGQPTGRVQKVQLWADDIIRLADEIKRIRLLSATKEEMPDDLYGF